MSVSSLPDFLVLSEPGKMGHHEGQNVIFSYLLRTFCGKEYT